MRVIFLIPTISFHIVLFRLVAFHVNPPYLVFSNFPSLVISLLSQTISHLLSPVSHFLSISLRTMADRDFLSTKNRSLFLSHFLHFSVEPLQKNVFRARKTDKVNSAPNACKSARLCTLWFYF